MLFMVFTLILFDVIDPDDSVSALIVEHITSIFGNVAVISNAK